MNRREFLMSATVLSALPWIRARAQESIASPAPSAAVQAAARAFLSAHLQTDGRIVDNGNGGITHTEGLGVGLLCAQALNDRASFDRIFGFCGHLRRPDGLYSWKYVPGHGVADYNNASDGDLYLAWALLRAGLRWSDRTLLQAAAASGAALRTHCVAKTNFGPVLLPGVVGFLQGSTAIVNPSYWAFRAFSEIAAIDMPEPWQELRRTGLSILESARFGSEGLPADWLILTDPLTPWRERPARFGYEAIRIPLFLTWAAEGTHPALRACAQYMRASFPAWTALDHSERANYSAPPGFEAVARLTRRAVFGTPYISPVAQGDYYSLNLTALSALAAQDLAYL